MSDTEAEKLNVLRISDEALNDLTDMINRPEAYNIRKISDTVRTEYGLEMKVTYNDDRWTLINLQLVKE